MARPGENFHLILIPAMVVQAIGGAVAALAVVAHAGATAIVIGLFGAFVFIVGSLLLVWGASIYCAMEDDHPAWAFLGLLNLPGLIVLLDVLGSRRREMRRGFDVVPNEPFQAMPRPDAAPRPPSPLEEGGGEGAREG
jgi:hypothetical protein